MARLSVQLFGKFCVTGAERTNELYSSAKAQELFCYLLVFRERAHPRETLASVLWGDNPTAQAKKYLRQTLWQLQTALSNGPAGSEPDPVRAEALEASALGAFLHVEPDWVTVNGEADVWLDVATFERAFAEVQGLRGRELDTTHAEQLKDAVQLYRGDLLEGWYQDWCLFERERLQNEYLMMLDKLMGYCEAHARYDDGLRYGELMLRVDRARERTHQRLMRLYYRAGHRSAALRQYARCVAALEQELGVGPAQATEELYRQICADELDEARRGAEPPLGGRLLARPGLIARLTRLQKGLAELQAQIEREIQELRVTSQEAGEPPTPGRRAGG